MSKSEECIICKSKIKMLLYCNCHRRKLDQAKQEAYENCLVWIEGEFGVCASDNIQAKIEELKGDS